MEIQLDKPTLRAAQLAYFWAIKSISEKEHTVKYASKSECRLYMALEEDYIQLVQCFGDEAAGLVIEALDVVQQGYILRAFYLRDKPFDRIWKYMTPKDMAKAMFGLNTPEYIKNILESLPKDIESSVIAVLTDLAIQRIDALRKDADLTKCLPFVCEEVLALLPKSARRCNDPACPFGEYEKKAGCILLSGDLEKSTHIACGRFLRR